MPSGNPAAQIGTVTCVKPDNPPISGPLTLPGVTVKTGASNLWVPFLPGLYVPTVGGVAVQAVSLLSTKTLYPGNAPFILVGATITLTSGHTGPVTVASAAGLHVTIN